MSRSFIGAIASQTFPGSVPAVLAAVVAALLVISIAAIGFAGPPQPGPGSANGPAAPRGNPACKVTPPEPPVSLSDPDGQELVLEEFSIRAAVHGMLSLTEMTFVFRNREPRRREGRFQCVLPAGAAISRFAKDVNGQLMEGEVVERLRANRIYDEILHEMRDPALLEQDQGNRFSARIFPIEPNAAVRLVLSYSRLLPNVGGVRSFQIPLRGLSRIRRFQLEALVASLPGETPLTKGAAAPLDRLTAPSGSQVASALARTVSMDEHDYLPTQDLEISWRAEPDAPPARVLTAGAYSLTAFRAPARTPPPADREASRPWVFFIDTSASTADGLSHRVSALESVFGTLPKDAPIEVLLFDQEIQALAKTTPESLRPRIASVLSERGALGGTDLFAALARMADMARKRPQARFVLVSDGVATLGKTEDSEIAKALANFPAGTPLHALVLGPRQDENVLRLVTKGRGRLVNVPFTETLEDRARDAVASLARPVGSTLRVEDPSAEWFFPVEVTDVQPGDEVLVLAKNKPGATPAARLVGSRGERAASPDARPLATGAFGPLLEREAYRAYLAFLADRAAHESSPEVRSALMTEQTRISLERRILVPQTTLLVLESDADYRRFGLDRRSLAEILTVGPTGIARLDRAPAFAPLPNMSRETDSPGTSSELSISNRPGDAPQNLGEPPHSARKVASPTRDRSAANAVEVPAASAPAGRREGPSRQDAAGREQEVSQGSDELEDGVPGGVEGGVSGGVVGGTPGGIPSSHPTGAAGGSAHLVTPLAPPPVPRPARVTPPVDVPKPPAWTTPRTVSEAKFQSLLSAIESSPRSREAYNQLTEALAIREEWKRLRETARRWQAYDPENPQVYEMLGLASSKLGLRSEAARAFSSLVEIAPSRPELLQRAGLLLLAHGEHALAEAPLRKAVALRPDRVNAHRHLALLLWQTGRFDEAVRVLEGALGKTYPSWYGNVRRVVAEELGYILRDAIEKDPARAEDYRRRAREAGIALTQADALRVTLVWETDANDVDLHVVDPNGKECFYSHKSTRSGLELYEDITQGFGPEVIRTARVFPGTYHIGVNYFSAGPMGVSRGILVVMTPQPKDSRPSIRILPFRLVQGGRDMRLVLSFEP